MMKGIRYACWLIDNIKFSGEHFTYELEYNGEKIELLITDYNGLGNLGNPLDDWVCDKIINKGIIRSVNAPSPIHSVFIITKSSYNSSKIPNFIYNLRLSLRLVFYSPTLISHASELLADGTISLPIWESFKNVRTSSRKKIDIKSLDKVANYLSILNDIGKVYYPTLEEIYKITEIGDVLIELLSLYSFIEGFWSDANENSSISKSLEAMLKDYEPNKSEKHKREVIKRDIKSQNELFDKSSIDRMRHILAHGMYKYKENDWDKDQWKAIYEQRDLLIETIIHTLINKMKREK